MRVFYFADEMSEEDKNAIYAIFYKYKEKAQLNFMSELEFHFLYREPDQRDEVEKEP